MKKNRIILISIIAVILYWRSNWRRFVYAKQQFGETVICPRTS